MTKPQHPVTFATRRLSDASCCRTARSSLRPRHLAPAQQKSAASTAPGSTSIALRHGSLHHARRTRRISHLHRSGRRRDGHPALLASRPQASRPETPPLNQRLRERQVQTATLGHTPHPLRRCSTVRSAAVPSPLDRNTAAPLHSGTRRRGRDPVVNESRILCSTAGLIALRRVRAPMTTRRFVVAGPVGVATLS
jgi:hypothetical protein